jgi:thiol-disulfide isomerase/thioredoxin
MAKMLVTLCVALMLTISVDASRTKSIPSWACAIERCHPDNHLAAADGAATKVQLSSALRGRDVADVEDVAGATSQVMCPYGGEAGGGGEAPSKQEVKNFFDGFGKAYDKVHGVKSDDAAATTTQAPITTALPSAAPGEIQAVDDSGLSQLMEAQSQDLLVIFYAPWCAHCKAFVMAADAPIKQLSQELVAQNGPKLVTFDTTSSPPPSWFNSPYVPSVVRISRDGATNTFPFDPMQSPSELKTFALTGAR